MSDEERYGVRDLTYSKWHRPSSGFLGTNISYIDLDCCEYCKVCYTPLALLELAKDVGQPDKAVMVTHHLAKQANLPAYLVFYRPNPDVRGGIDRFRIRQIYPEGSFSFELMLAPDDYASWLTAFHDEHHCHRWKEINNDNTK